MKAVALAFALVLVATPARAQSAESRWEPWLGCWELSADNVRSGAPAAGRLADATRAARPGSESTPRVCVTAAGNGAARFETTVRGQAAIEYTVVADATDRPLTDAECRGTQRAEWSRDGLRLFSHAELTCDGDGGPRRVSGLSLLAPNGTWLDIQAVDVAGRETVRVRRYYRAEGEAAVPRATVAASTLTLEDVKEASAKVAPRALEAALVETNAGYDLTASRLLDLDDAGVSDSVIDLIVALSYPERFVVERTSRGGGGGTTFVNDPLMLGWAFGYPVWYDDYYYSPYYYSPFGFNRLGFGRYDIAGGGLAVVPVPSEPQPSGTGRVVDGQGYTRVRPRETASADNGQTTSTRSRTSSSTPAPAGSSSSGGSSGTASSGGGYSGGSSSGDTGRTAQPR